MTTTAQTSGGQDAPVIRNGVPVTKLFATRDRLIAEQELARFRFTARNTWIEGTASQWSIHEWYGVGTDHVHVEEFNYTADHPTLGNGHGPTARRIDLTSVASILVGGIDVRGALSFREERRPGQPVVPVSVRPDFSASPWRSRSKGCRRR